MRSVSSEFLELQSKSKAVATRVEVLDSAGVVLHTFASVTSGSVESDRNAAHRHRASLTAQIPFSLVPGTLLTADMGEYGADGMTFGDPAGTFGQADSAEQSTILTPFGNRLRIQRGVQLSSGAWEYVPVGSFRITRVGTDHGPTGVLAQLAGVSPSQEVSWNRWEEPYVIPAGTNYGTAIQALLANRFPGAVFSFAATTETTPQIVLGLDANNDPWRDACDMAEACSLELFVDGSGTFVLAAPVVVSDANAVMEITGATVLSSSRTIDAETIYNKVVATSETVDGAPLRSTAEDNNPSSLTMYGGPFGKRQYFYSSPLMTSQSMVDAAAQSLLDRLLGFDEELSLAMPVHAALEVGDVVIVSSARAKLTGAWRVDSIGLPLDGASEMSVTLHRRRSTL